MDVNPGILIISVMILAIAAALLIAKRRRDAELPPAYSDEEKERRLSDRKKTALRLKYKTGAGEEGVAWLKDINTNGARMLHTTRMDVGTDLTLEISLPFDKKPITAEARVAWAGRDETGLKFDKAGEKDILRIVQYISDRSRLAGGRA